MLRKRVLRKRVLREIEIADQQKPKLSTDDVIATVADGAAVGGMIAITHASLSPILAIALQMSSNAIEPFKETCKLGLGDIFCRVVGGGLEVLNYSAFIFMTMNAALDLFIAESLTQLGIPQIGPNPAFDYEAKCLLVGSLAGAGYSLYSLFSERNKAVENDHPKALPKSRF